MERTVLLLAMMQKGIMSKGIMTYFSVLLFAITAINSDTGTGL